MAFALRASRFARRLPGLSCPVIEPGACRARTEYLNQTQQTKKGHLKVTFVCLARPTGFEPVTPAFGGQYSIQLSYGRIWNCVG